MRIGFVHHNFYRKENLIECKDCIEHALSNVALLNFLSLPLAFFTVLSTTAVMSTWMEDCTFKEVEGHRAFVGAIN